MYVTLKEAEKAVTDESRNTEFWQTAHKDDVAQLKTKIENANKIFEEFWDKWDKEIRSDLQSEDWGQIAEDAEAILERLKTTISNPELVKEASQ